MSLSEAKKTPRRIKYIIVASDDGIVQGAFKPDEPKRAQKYLEEIKKKEPSLKVGIYKVSNLNQFLANLRYGKKTKRPASSGSPSEGCQPPLVEDGNEKGNNSDSKV